MLLLLLLLLLLCSYFSYRCATVPVPDDKWEKWISWWNENWQRKLKYLDKTCPNATVSTTNPTWTDLGLNSGHYHDPWHLTAVICSTEGKWWWNVCLQLWEQCIWKFWCVTPCGMIESYQHFKGGGAHNVGSIQPGPIKTVTSHSFVCYIINDESPTEVKLQKFRDMQKWL
jgi:hypothetical protein